MQSDPLLQAEVVDQSAAAIGERPVADNVQSCCRISPGDAAKRCDAQMRGFLLDESPNGEDALRKAPGRCKALWVDPARDLVELGCRTADPEQIGAELPGRHNDAFSQAEKPLVVANPVSVAQQTGCVVTMEMNEKRDPGFLAGARELAAGGPELGKDRLWPVFREKVYHPLVVGLSQSGFDVMLPALQRCAQSPRRD
jgi:hypothetical protein